MRAGYILLLCCSLSSAQTIKGHTIGESLSDFISQTPKGSEQIQSCRSAGSDRKLGKKLKVNIDECSELLSAIDHGARLVLSHPPNFDGELTYERGLLTKIILKVGEDAFLSAYDHRKLVYFDDVTRELAEKFGKPSDHSDLVTQNGFGATSHHRGVYWDTTELHIEALETDPNLHNPITLVTVETRDEYKRAIAENAPNKALD